MRSLSQIVVASFFAGVSGHGSMIVPMSRQPGLSTLSTAGTECVKESCGWRENPTAIPGEPTVCNRKFLTTNMAKEGTGHGHPCSIDKDFTKTAPWRAPGTAPLASPCGKLNGIDAINLPPAARLVWQQGATVEVAMTVNSNHGGGYIYRLCAASDKLTEECFQKNSLPFANDMTTVQFINGTRISIPATRISQSNITGQWTKNPIPHDPNYFSSSFLGGVGNHWEFSLIDQVKLPAGLTPGDYVISWRWDCEAKTELWTNCGDVTITADSPGPAPVPPAPVPPAPTPVPPAPTPAPKPPTPLTPTCCWSTWGDSSNCGSRPASAKGGACNTDWTKPCASNSDCEQTAYYVAV